MYHLETYFTQMGNRKDRVTGAISYPIHLSTAYRHEGLGESTGFDYTRTKNPTRSILEESFQQIEGGAGCCATSSGMAAIQLALSLFTSGDELLVTEDLYGGTYRLFEDYQSRYHILCHYVDPLDLAAISQAITQKTKAIFVETITNPLLTKVDIRALSKIAKQHKLLLIVDNTFLTPYLYQPIRDGADIVIHSATKYLAGHNDCLSGLIVAKDEHIYQVLADNHNSSGATLSPLDSYLLMRGLKTLPLRLDRQVANAKRLREWLEHHPFIHRVYYPEVGAMISFEVSNPTQVDQLLRHLNLISFAESLGGVESFITYPKTQTHADLPEHIQVSRGVTARLLRFSVGTEDVGDLIDDLTQAFNKIN
ncbi:cystathionine gamma-synthase [Halolactibacillus alkaliphilus]|uniref:Cystathionine gamma-synthase n=1 Tax=Halolactibacillus alkaliphilus TaxID=442899 RepID=A0A511X1C8_9BACI|nr:aminotransferase class I/II-fold pyridoxal phosphate-dependent enzyme [Halolactibacillus alkaliphilus]GEN56754.1 cystathionine gamma-synthase [Halolactibacillus alkaliphilus]GGN70829.1 cystathionine gamma-synthase [Halolactibacillus alkaliphilus]SFO79856.1 cystathionine gamma-synthase [Halolactibacillus alkaliphilus]